MPWRIHRERKLMSVVTVSLKIPLSSRFFQISSHDLSTSGITRTCQVFRINGGIPCVPHSFQRRILPIASKSCLMQHCVEVREYLCCGTS